MKYPIIKIFFLIGFPLLAALCCLSCREDYMEIQDFNKRTDNLPVDVEVNIKPLDSTRGLLDESKTSFSNNELIHIRAEYTCDDLENPGMTKEEIQYGVMKYSGNGKWIYESDEYSLTWPRTAKTAKFTAFYLYGTTGVLTANTMQPIMLSDFNYGEDPLTGVAENVEWGHTVRFDMEHIFTHLLLTQIASGISDEMYFIPPYNADPKSDYQQLNNAFRLEYDEETKVISGVFMRIPDDNYKDKDGNGLVYVAGKTENYDDIEEDGEVRARVRYFLEPRAYTQFELMYPRSRNETATYLSYGGNLTNKTGSEGLLRNHYYEFSILKSSGISMEENPEDGWDDSTPVEILDVEEFIKAVNRGESYSQEDPESGQLIEILESSSVGTILLKNIDFHHEYYDIIDGNFLPDLSLTFDGNYHSIYNMVCPLFNENHGTIKNLGIKDAVTQPEHPLISNENYEGIQGGRADFSRNGIICRTNVGTVSNMHLDHVEMEVQIKTTGTTYEDASREAHNAALLIGSNRGTVSNIRMGGKMALTVKNEGSITTLPNVVIGSLTGQNLGAISDVASLEEDEGESPVYTIKNECNGSSGVYMVGGVVGNNTGTLSNIMMSSITVDATESLGVESLMGGVVGYMPLSTSGAPIIDACIIRGNVIGGPTNSMININSNSYIGGVAGLMNCQGIVTNSSVSFGVVGTDYYDNRVNYGVGGAFGRIEKIAGVEEGEINTLACFGSELSGVKNIGNFAGVAPEGFTIEEHYSGKNINFKHYYENPDIAVFQ